MMKPQRVRLRSMVFRLVLIAALPLGSDAATVALIGGTLVDGNGGQPLRDTTVVIEGERIVAAGPMNTVAIPADAVRYDVRGKYVLPGFIDLHTHLTVPADGRQQSESLSTLRALHFMDLFVNAGITSVRDLGSTVESMQALTRAQQVGYIRSLRVHAVGQLITSTGGHGPPWARFADGPDGFRNAVRTLHAAGFKYVKLAPPYTQEEVSAAVDEANVHRMKVTSHAGGYDETVPPVMAKRAVLAGVACIEHLNQMPLDVLDMIAARKIHVVPTLQVLKLFHQMPVPPPSLVELRQERGWSMEMHEELFKQALKRHILMGIGTDGVGDFPDDHYPQMYFDEIENFVRLGMTRLQAITAATKNGAIILDREGDLGTLEVGKLADLQVVDTNPLESFKPLGTPALVILGGSILRDTISARESH